MLFADSQIVGTFKGFNERGLEFAAEIVAPYDASMLDRPQLGQFLLVELGSQEEAFSRTHNPIRAFRMIGDR